MGRDASKAKGNPYYERRLEAAKFNDSLYSREKAAELLGVSASSLAEYETGVTKFVPVDKVVLMADLYNAPDLCNRYCLNDCPIGDGLSISDEVCDINRVTVKLLKNLKVKDLEKLKDKLIEIASDGVISEDEIYDLGEIIEYLDLTSKTISELKTLFIKTERSMNV